MYSCGSGSWNVNSKRENCKHGTSIIVASQFCHLQHRTCKIRTPNMFCTRFPCHFGYFSFFLIIIHEFACWIDAFTLLPCNTSQYANQSRRPRHPERNAAALIRNETPPPSSTGTIRRRRLMTTAPEATEKTNPPFRPWRSRPPSQRQPPQEHRPPRKGRQSCSIWSWCPLSTEMELLELDESSVSRACRIKTIGPNSFLTWCITQNHNSCVSSNSKTENHEAKFNNVEPSIMCSEPWTIFQAGTQ
jgi:hypothetical protein